MWAIVIILILLFIYVLFLLMLKKTQIIRFSKPTCKFCIESQPEWDAFKELALTKKLNIEIIDVDITNNSIHTRTWLAKYNVTTVPTIIKINMWGSYVYNGPLNRNDYLNFITN